MSVYSLPVLSRLEIVGILAEYQIINLSETDLTNPTPNFVFNLYTSLLLHLDSLQLNFLSLTSIITLMLISNPKFSLQLISVA